MLLSAHVFFRFGGLTENYNWKQHCLVSRLGEGGDVAKKAKRNTYTMYSIIYEGKGDLSAPTFDLEISGS